MNFFKRATTSILRRPGKSVILLLLVFILGSVIAGAISVRGAINNTDANLRRRMQPLVSISFDWMEWQDSLDITEADREDPAFRFPQEPSLTASQVREIAALPYVASYDYMITGSMQSFTLDRYIGDEERWTEPGMPEWFSLRGTSSTELVHVEQGVINILPGGRQFNDADLLRTPGAEHSVAIVSQEFANENNLALGSLMELYLYVFMPEDPDDADGWRGFGPDMFEEDNVYAIITVAFEVIGIFEMPEDPDENVNDPWRRFESLNTFYVPNWIIEEIWERSTEATRSSWENIDFELPEWATGILEDDERENSVRPIFVLADPGDIEDFRAAAAPLLPEFHEIEDLSSTFDDIASSMDTMQGIANWILWVSVGATLLILSLLITLFLRDRRYEMGVYLALGEKKGKIIAQILMEVVVTSFVAITLAVFAGNLISGQMSRNMLRNALVEQATQNEDPWGWGGSDWSIFDEIGIPTTEMTTDEMMEAFQVSLDFETIGLFYLVGLGAVVLSTMVPVLYVVTLNPKKVLM